MSLEQAILDRLEKRNEENARLQNIINDLERSADASSKQERETYDALVAYIQKMRAQIESDRLEREQMQHQITELRSERDRILEISKSLVPKSALKQAVLDAAGLSSEVAKLRAEVPLESTREALKNAVAKLQEVTTEKDRMRLQLENARADLKQVLIERDSLGLMAADRALEIRKLMDGYAEDMKAQAELLSKYESLLTKITDLGSYAMTLGRNEGEPLEMFMERLALRIAAIESQTRPLHDEIARLNAKVGPLEKLYEVVKKHVDNGAIIDNRADIYDAVAETAKALSQLTA